MKQILVYADSLSWGIIPGTRRRLAFHSRWPGALELELNAKALPVRVIEDCLNGRRTVWDDPFKAGRNGLAGIGQRIEVNSPLELVILMLGTNDFQSTHSNNAWHSSQGIAQLIRAIREAPIEPEMPVPKILVVAPPPIDEPKGSIAPKFQGGADRCRGAADAYRAVAMELGCSFFDSATVISASTYDGVHLDEPQHKQLGAALVVPVANLLTASAHAP